MKATFIILLLIIAIPNALDALGVDIFRSPFANKREPILSGIIVAICVVCIIFFALN